MKILVIHTMTGASSEFIQREREIFARYASAGTQIEIAKIEHGAASIESHFDEYLGAIETFKQVVRAEQESYDGIIISCFANANVEPAREIAGIPVIGSGMATMSLANLLGHKFGIIMSKESSNYRHQDWANKLGFGAKMASFQKIDFSVLGMLKDPEATKRSFLIAAKRAIAEGADVVFPACFGMIGLADEVQSELEVPVIDPAGAAIGVMESLIRLGRSHSKFAYPYPPAKKRDYDIGYQTPHA